MRKLFLFGIIITCLLLTISLTAVQGQDDDVALGSLTWLRIRCGAGGYSALERADIVQKRATDILVLGGVNLDLVRITKQGNDAAIYLGDKLLITVGRADAAANKTNPYNLAVYWADRLKQIYPQVYPETPSNIN